ncbi:PREDICTED: putative defensin-like protein 262 [Tarenaya hassleriana]|uniref:putative defensin-like protein 262 n=1 Tax=Tarenaya hassleriana TaxID=28532 RepID=UPI00053C9DBF|nr:PREDICTED: putative defensin-like protein 262 [Tarenaya hassleriana]
MAKISIKSAFLICFLVVVFCVSLSEAGDVKKDDEHCIPEKPGCGGGGTQFHSSSDDNGPKFMVTVQDILTSTCESDSDCAAFCSTTQLPVCFSGHCGCTSA